MAHSAETNSLVAALTNHILHGGDDDTHHHGRESSQAQSLALKAVKSGQYARTNQFEVHARLDGLEEKFRVRNREALADALRHQLDRLQKVQTKVTPEVLALLLELSDHPVVKTDLAAIEPVNVHAEDPGLTWEDILADDPFTNDEGLWDDVSQHSHSSLEADDATDQIGRARLASTDASSVDEDSSQPPDIFVAADSEALQVLRLIRADLSSGRCSEDIPSDPFPVNGCELFLIREGLLLVQGFPTTLFTTVASRNDGIFTTVGKNLLRTSSATKLAAEFVVLADPLTNLRAWCREPQRSLLVQRYQASISQKLLDLNYALSKMEEDFVRPKTDLTVSVMEIIDRARDFCGPLLRIGEICSANTGLGQESWSLLDAIFEECCVAQLVDDQDRTAWMQDLFMKCLEVYLIPVRRWITEGVLLGSEDDMMFIESNASFDGKSLGSLWHDRFVMRVSKSGSVCATSFMQPLVARIFSAGKSVMMLRAISQREGPVVDETATLSTDNAAFMLPPSSPFTPFEESLQAGLTAWVKTTSQSQPEKLRHALIQDYNLLKMYQSFAHIYLSTNGAAFGDFATCVVERMCDMRSHWADQYVLTDTLRTAHVHALRVRSDELFVKVAQSESDDREVPMVHELRRLKLHCSIPWPLQNITREASPSACQDTAMLLLQIAVARLQLTNLRLPRGTDVQSAASHLAMAAKLRFSMIRWVDLMYDHFCQTANAVMDDLVAATGSASSIDDMAAAYHKFSHELRWETFTTNEIRHLNQAVVSILGLCEPFASLWSDLVPRSKASRASSSNEDQPSGGDHVDEADTGAPGLWRGARGSNDQITELASEFESRSTSLMQELSIAASNGHRSLNALVERLS